MTGHEATRTVTFEQLADLREKTERLSQFLSQRLKNHLTTLYPILAPRRTFGKYVGFKEAIARAFEAYNRLAEKYREVSGAAFDLRNDFDEEALSAMEYAIEVYPWKYINKPIPMFCPFQWVITYRSGYPLSEMQRLMVRKGDPRKTSARHFLINALATHIVLSHNPGALQLLDDLRYEVRLETGLGSGILPLFIVSSIVSSFRPPDELMLSAIRLSGVPAFIEMVTWEAVPQLAEPLRQRIETTLGD